MVMDKSYPVTLLQDYNLEEWARCSYKFYNSRILNRHPDVLNWRQMVQYAVNHVIHDGYALPAEQRTPEHIEHLIAKRWKIRPSLFPSAYHEKLIRRTVTEQLIRYFTGHRQSGPLLFLFESYTVRVEELGVELSMIVQVAEWSQKSFVIRKLFVDSDPDVISCFQHVATLFCYKAFGKLPESIEALSLLTGQTVETCPTAERDVAGAIHYVRTMMERFEHSMYTPRLFSQTECHSCPFQETCTSVPPTRRMADGTFIRVS
ncbi:hypothetical protein ACFFK0_18780 [Paenibacillus chartarius]|uniref:PD-(D/E)XK endonuclease-like domain-containing protein n=1 Tax=Paenibacillus chartarius TaxID=747481 RepID=A0ABV6DPA6_9BACL